MARKLSKAQVETMAQTLRALDERLGRFAGASMRISVREPDGRRVRVK